METHATDLGLITYHILSVFGCADVTFMLALMGVNLLPKSLAAIDHAPVIDENIMIVRALIARAALAKVTKSGQKL